MKETHPIPPSFHLRKSKILANLSIPDADYTDLSPKGSVDEGIRDLIESINALPGLVTTSSCAGRISVFLEGRREKQTQASQQEGPERQFAPSGGKGAGRWLYVSHEPLHRESGSGSLHGLFGIVVGEGDGKVPSSKSPRLVRFIFEPMILHIMAATLHHAHPVLAAASSAGFRESGLQSLRCLDEDDAVSPVVAVRSSGLVLESIIGYCEEGPVGDSLDSEPVVRSLVSEEYLRILVEISNERFGVNAERKERFRSVLLDLCSTDRGRRDGWEDSEERRARKRAEGLRKQREIKESTRDYASDGGDVSDSDELGSFF